MPTMPSKKNDVESTPDWEKETQRRFVILVVLVILFAVVIILAVIGHNSSTKQPAYKPRQPVSQSQKEALKETMALMLNLNGHLCAKVISIKPLKIDKHFEVTCIEYRGGRARVTYIFNGVTGTAFKK